MHSNSELKEMIVRMVNAEKVGVVEWLTSRMMDSRNAKPLVHKKAR